MSAVIIEAYTDWECPNCHFRERTRPLPPNASRMHPCPGLHGLTAPAVRAGSDCKVYAVERMDYLRDEEQRTGEDGKPYMSVITERADGTNDAHVFPGVAVWGKR